jgi:CDP-ribitol ribitolphosphotransferase
MSLPAFAEAFGQPPECFVMLGIPRTDPLVDEAWVGAAAERVRRAYGILPERKILLYAPTFRGPVTHDAAHGELLELSEVGEALAEEYVLLLRAHPLIAASAEVDAEGVVDVSAHDNVNELLAAADLLVTDYSSIIFEYSLLVRPMLFFAPDREAYERERGVYFEYESWVPGPVFDTTGDVVAFLERGEFDAEKSRDFASRAFAVADGHASRRVVDELIVANLR